MMLNRILLMVISLALMLFAGCGSEAPEQVKTDTHNAEPGLAATPVNAEEKSEPPPRTPTVEDCALVLNSFLSKRLVTHDVVYGQAFAFKDGESLSRSKPRPRPNRIPRPQFSEVSSEPDLAGKLIDCAVKAQFVGEVSVEFKSNTKTIYRFEFTATQEQMEGLYRISYNDQFTKAITWDKERLRAGREKAR
ncbi:MAG: hypothetical protein KDA84_10575, partial [Planctomycetaceae bacterium]|nr:hypothetical protein [Planctomycetaceae bacterium]